MDISRYKLKNNIRIVHQHKPGRVSHLGLMINTGSRDENIGQEGIAHFIEHTIFKGTKSRKAFQVLGRMDNVGGEVNAYTTKEETCLYSSFLNSHLQRAIEWFADVSQNSIFPEKEINKEKEFSKADLIMITDGNSAISDRFLKDFLDWKHKKNVNIFSILVDKGWASTATLNEFSDKVETIDNIDSKGNHVARSLFSTLW